MEYDIKDEDIKLEVFIHMAPQIAMGFGYMDIGLNDTVYSYGTYEPYLFIELHEIGTKADGIQEVSGSIPLISTKNLRNLRISKVFLILRHENVAFSPVSRNCLTLI